MEPYDVGYRAGTKWAYNHVNIVPDECTLERLSSALYDNEFDRMDFEQGFIDGYEDEANL